MARLTKQERDLLAQLNEKAQAEQAEDEGYEILVKNDAGHTITLKGEKARKYMAKHFPGVDDEDEPEEVEETDAIETEDEIDEEPGGSGGYFKGRRR